MMTRERFAETNWKMSYEEYQKCDCTECDKENCIHRGAYRRVPEINGGLGIGGYVTKELKEQFSDLFQEREIGTPFWWYEIVAVYTLNKIYDNGIGIYPGIKV